MEGLMEFVAAEFRVPGIEDPVWSCSPKFIPQVGSEVFLPYSIQQEHGLGEDPLLVRKVEHCYFRVNDYFQEYVVVHCERKSDV